MFVGGSDDLDDGTEPGGQLNNPGPRPLGMTGPVTANPCMPSYSVPPLQPAAAQLVPDMSYSSSEDEDDFFDAEDSSQTAGLASNLVEF